MRNASWVRKDSSTERLCCFISMSFSLWVLTCIALLSSGKIRRQAAGFKAMQAKLQEKEQYLKQLSDVHEKAAKQLASRYSAWYTAAV